MSDWTCEVIAAVDGVRRVVRWHLALADGLSRAEVEVRGADPPRGFYSPDTRGRALMPERWSPVLGSASTRGSPAAGQLLAPQPTGDGSPPTGPLP
ncbi:hypothetical protein ACLBYD_27345 [Rhodococcus sp. C26F]